MFQSIIFSVLALGVAAVPNVLERAVNPTCYRDDCLRALIASTRSAAASTDCSSYVQSGSIACPSTTISTVTVTPTPDTTVSTYTVTATYVDYDDETFTSTLSSTVTVTRTSVVTTTSTLYSSSTCPDSNAGSTATIPRYASACSPTLRYASACSCIGIQSSNGVAPPSTRTITSTSTAVPSTITSMTMVTTVLPVPDMSPEQGTVYRTTTVTTYDTSKSTQTVTVTAS